MTNEIQMTNPVLSDDLRANWAAMNQGKHDRGVLDRFNQRKLGMFVHWGLYSISAGSWKGERSPGICEWIMWFAQIPRAEYAELAAEFNPDKFDAAEWVRLAKDAGMTYLVITSKHHDGFALWDSAVSDFTIARMTPSDLQPLDALYEECQKQGLGFGLYYSHVIDWRDGWEGEGGATPDTMISGDSLKCNPMNAWDPANVSRRHYFDTKAYPQLEELLERYPKLHCIWFDYWYEGKYLNPPEAYAFYKLVHDKQPDCLVNSRVDGYECAGKTLGDYVTPGDNMLIEPGQRVHWETAGTLNNTWGYSDYDDDWKSESELVYWIVSIISQGGNYLLNIGPKADGSIPQGTYDAFDHIGRWMAVNGEAVYGTTSWDVQKEGPASGDFGGTTDRKDKGFQSSFTSRDVWFSCKQDTVYALGLVWPDDDTVVVESMVGRSVRAVALLGTDQPIEWRMDACGLVAILPKIERDTIGFTVKVSLNG